MRIRLLSILLACCALATPFAQAQTTATPAHDPKMGSAAGEPSGARPAPRPPFKWWAIDKYKQELRLTADQSTEIEKIFQASMDRLRVDKEDLDRQQSNFQQLMEKTSVDDREFQRVVDRLEMARYYVSKERTLMLVRIHSVLTPDQRKGLEAIRQRNDGDRNRQQH
jgi:Spy/CpxP family protein refolding chaperone